MSIDPSKLKSDFCVCPRGNEVRGIRWPSLLAFGALSKRAVVWAGFYVRRFSKLVVLSFFDYSLSCR